MTDKKMTFPTCAAEFLSAISHDLEIWQVAIIDAEIDDEQNKSRVVFWLASDTVMTAYVANEYGRMIVNISGAYHFDLNRINENLEYTWLKHLLNKGWATDHQIELVKKLEKLFQGYVKN